MHICGCHRLCDNRVYQIWRTKFSFPHWLYTQNGLNLFLRWQQPKKDADEKRKILILPFFVSIYFKNSAE